MADFSPLASLAAPTGRAWDTILALLAALIATAVDHLDLITKLSALIVVLLTVWEKPTVQRLVERLRQSRGEKPDDVG